MVWQGAILWVLGERKMLIEIAIPVFLVLAAPLAIFAPLLAFR
jgi:hypothetical protein